MRSTPQHSASPGEMGASVWRNRHLVKEMVKREVVGRYRNSIIGLAWSFFHPLLMLSIYTLVFGVVFKARWGLNGEQNHLDFAIVLFVGIIIHQFFAECVTRAPELVVSNVNYVKKAVFPLEVLPVVTLGGALFHAAVNFTVLLAALVVFKGHIHWTAILLPFIVIPFAVVILGVSWFLASIGVFVRDLGHVVGIFATALLFMSPVFYNTSALPERFQAWIMLNPLTFIIEQAREVLIWGRPVNWMGLGLYMAIGFAVACGGFYWFQKTRKGFADVL